MLFFDTGVDFWAIEPFSTHVITKLSCTGVDESLLATSYQHQGTEYVPQATHSTENLVYISDHQSAHQNTGYTPQNQDDTTHTKYAPHKTRY